MRIGGAVSYRLRSSEFGLSAIPRIKVELVHADDYEDSDAEQGFEGGSKPGSRQEQEQVSNRDNKLSRHILICLERLCIDVEN